MADVEILGNGNPDGTSVVQADEKLSLFGGTPVTKPTALTTGLTSLTSAGFGSGDYAVQALTSVSAFGFATKDEGETVVHTLINVQTRVDELETKLKAIGAIS